MLKATRSNAKLTGAAGKGVIEAPSAAVGTSATMSTPMVSLSILILGLSITPVTALAFRASTCECFPDMEGGGQAYLMADFSVLCGECTREDTYQVPRF